MIFGRSNRHIVNKSTLVFMALVLAISGVIFAFCPASAAGDNIAYSHQIGTRAPISSLRRSAIAPDGTLWIVNTGTSQEIIHVSAAGERIGEISRDNYDLFGVAVDSSGKIYMLTLADVFVFDSSGNYLSTVTLPPTSVSPPRDIAIDSQGNIYVSYFYNEVKKYDSSGNELLTIGNGLSGSADGQFRYQDGIFVDDNDHLYVADNGNSRVQTFDSNGNFINKWDVNWPQDVAVQGGQAYAIYGYSRDVQINDVSTSAFVGNFAVADPASSGALLSGIAIGDDGTFYLNDLDQLVLVDSSYDLISSHDDIVADHEGSLHEANLIAKDSAGNIYVYDNSYVPLGNDYRQIQKFTPAGQFIESITIRVQYSDVDGNQYYASPHQSFQIDNSGNFYFGGSFYQTVFDGETLTSGSYGVVKFGAAGGEPSFMVKTSDHNEDYTYYYSIMIGSMIIDPATAKITVAASVYEDMDGTYRQYLGATFDADGSNRQWLGDPLPADGSFSFGYPPYDLVKGPDGNLYFTGYYQTYDTESNISTSYRALRTDSSGHNLLPFIESYVINGDIETDTNAYSIGVDRNGNVYIGGYITKYDLVGGTQLNSCIIGQFSISGEYLRCIVNQGFGTNQEDILNLNPGSTMIIDQYGNVYALDANAGVVKVYLIETAAPTPPLITSTNLTKNSIMVTWDPPTDDGNTSITNYVIRARLHGTNTWFEVAITDGAARSFTLTEINGSALNPDTKYDIQIIARSSAGESLPAEISAVTGVDDQAVTPGAPNTGF